MIVLVKSKNMALSIFTRLFLYNNDNDNNFRMSGMYFFMQPSLLIRDPEILKLVMIKDAEYFINRFNWIKNTDPLLSKGLNLLQGAKKKRWRLYEIL